MQRILRTLMSPQLAAGMVAALVFLLMCLVGEVVLQDQLRDRANQRRLGAMSYASAVRVRMERELIPILSLETGLSAYMTARNGRIDRAELMAILGEIYRSNPHAINFAIAVGYRVEYVYPLRGNERVVGLNYHDRPDQWPVVEQLSTSGQPGLAGPLDLVQGGRGLVYRVPILLHGKYWGLVSTVINHESLMGRVQRELSDSRYEFAVRGQDASGATGGSVWGDLRLFGHDDVLLQDMEVPGGRWVIGVRLKAPDETRTLRWSIRSGAVAVGTVFALMLFLLIRNRGLMARRAMYDELTGLPNRRLFEDRALMAFSRQQRAPHQLCALLFLDLDGFKDVNDRYGHKAGDAVLVEVARRSSAAVRQNDTVGRWGGDEFIVLLENVSAELLESIASRLRTSIEEPVIYQGRRMRVGVSIGRAIYPESGRDLDELLHAADSRMYRDKDERRQGFSRPLPLAE